MISAIVLAAGTSSRMGSPKPLLMVGGRTLLEHVLETVRDAHVDDIVVVLGHEAGRVRSQVSFDGARSVVNPAYADGMSSSIRAGVQAADARSDGFLIVLGDQPFVDPATIDALMSRRNGSNAKILIPTYEGRRGNPVLLDRSLSEEVQSITGDQGCRAIFGRHTQGILEVEALRALRDGRPRLMRLTPNARTSPSEEGVVEYVMECESGGTMDIYVEPQIPKPQLLVVGDSPVASALHALARVLDYRVAVVAPGATPSDFPGADQVVHDLDDIPPLLTPDTYAVVATMGKYDEEALTRFTGTRVAYLGLVASRRRAGAVLTNLEAAGVDSATRDRIHSPAGLDFAAETPEEIGLSILAPVTQVRRTSGAPERSLPLLRETEGVTHKDVVCGMDVEGDSPIRLTHSGQPV